MPRFEIEVVELRAVRCRYTIEADDLVSAKELAAIGETISEDQERRPPDVVHREVGEGWVAEEEQQCA